jgi:hypothetical protein
MKRREFITSLRGASARREFFSHSGSAKGLLQMPQGCPDGGQELAWPITA